MSGEAVLVIRNLGRWALDTVRYLGQVVLFGYRTIARAASPPFFLRESIGQIYFIGVRALPLISLAALSTGIVLCMQTIDILGKFGAQQYVAAVVGLSVVKELSPVITALLVAGRSGSGISAELGSMTVTRQVDALKVLAVNPVKYLAATRIIACILVLPMLTAISDLLGIMGGLLIASAQGGIEPMTYIFNTLDFLAVTDVVPGLIKASVFGLIIGTISCFEGLSVKGGTEGVGRSTTAAVVVSSLLILISDVYMTRIFLALFS